MTKIAVGDLHYLDRDGMDSKITFHFDGPIVENHKISLRVLARTLVHLQSAVDRSYLDLKHGKVWKHAKLKRHEYDEANFIVGVAREGGYLLDIFSGAASTIVSRISSAVGTVIDRVDASEGGGRQVLATQAEARLARHRKALSFDDYLSSDATELVKACGDRSIAKEIDQMLSPVRAGHRDNTLEIQFRTEAFRKDYAFDWQSARSFHRTISRRDLGQAIWVTSQIRSLDGGNEFSRPSGRVVTLATKREHVLHIDNEDSYNVLVPYMPRRGGKRKTVELLVCPVLEFGAFEPYGGDFYFLGQAKVVE